MIHIRHLRRTHPSRTSLRDRVSLLAHLTPLTLIAQQLQAMAIKTSDFLSDRSSMEPSFSPLDMPSPQDPPSLPTPQDFAGTFFPPSRPPGPLTPITAAHRPAGPPSVCASPRPVRTPIPQPPAIPMSPAATPDRPARPVPPRSTPPSRDRAHLAIPQPRPLLPADTPLLRRHTPPPPVPPSGTAVSVDNPVRDAQTAQHLLHAMQHLIGILQATPSSHTPTVQKVILPEGTVYGH